MRIKFYILTIVCLLSGYQSQAQFPLNGGNQGGYNPSGTLPGGVNQGGFNNNNGFRVDTTGVDSTQRPKVKPDTRFLDRNRLFTHLPYDVKTSGFDIGEIVYWEALDNANGFVQDLGMVGKPHQVWYHGFSEDYQRLPFWQQPVTGRYNRYMLNPETQVDYFDTHTPYTNMDYAQGPNTLHSVKATISQNISPQWNVAFYLNRLQSESPYRSALTDHFSLYLSSNYHTKNQRYWLFGNLAFNDLADLMNGGVPRSQDTSLTIVDGIIQDNTTLYNESFFKGNAAPVLDDAQSKQVQKSVYIDQYYHLIGYPGDTLQKANRLTLRGTAYYQYYYSRYTDFQISTDVLTQNLIPVYPTLVFDSAHLDESYHTHLYRATGEASYTLAFGSAFRLNVNGGLNYQRFVLQKDQDEIFWNLTDQNVRAQLNFPGFVAKANIQQRVSDRFDPERNLSLDAALYPLRFFGYRNQIPIDSLETDKVKVAPTDEQPEDGPDDWEASSPIKIYGRYDFRDMNPTFFQGWYPSRGENAWIANPNLKNQQLSHLLIGARWKEGVKITEKDTLLPSYADVGVFFQSANEFIFYTPKLQVQQAGADENLRWAGVEAKFRLRFLKHFFLESSVTAQQSFTNSTGALALYATAVPNIYGKASLYWDVRWRSFAEAMRIGVDVYSNSPFTGMTIDPLSQEFFPVNYQIPSYPRIDVFAAAQLMGVGVFARYIHANEGFPRSGYYTTPFYPALQRAFTFGVYWTFFD